LGGGYDVRNELGNEKTETKGSTFFGLQTPTDANGKKERASRGSKAILKIVDTSESSEGGVGLYWRTVTLQGRKQFQKGRAAA